MSSTICHQLVLSSWATGFLVISPPLILGRHLDFCDSNTIDHFICDISPILQLSFLDTHLLEIVVCLLGDPQDHIAIGNSFLLLYHQENYKIPL